MKTPEAPYLSRVDTEVFGFPVARARVASETQLPELVAFCRRHSARLLVIRSNASSSQIAQAVGAAGGLLTDTQLRYSLRVATAMKRLPEDLLPIRAATRDDREELGALARLAFEGYASHYHADPRLPRDRCDDIYARWLLGTLERPEPGEHVIVAEKERKLVGFGLLRIRGTEGEALLAGTSPTGGTSRPFIYRALLREGTRIAHRAGAIRAFTSTHVANVVVQRVWSEAGWLPHDATHTFHLWIDS